MLALNPTGDMERKFDLEISPLCNQQADSVPAIQIGECTHTYAPVTVNSLVSSHEPKFLSWSGEDPPLLCFLQDSSPTSWSLCLRSGTASPSPARSARPWWATCTRTRPAGAAYDTHTHLQTQRRTPTLMSLSLREEEEEKKRGKTSHNLPPMSSDVLSSFCERRRGSSSLFVLQHIFSRHLSITGSESGSTGREGERAPSAGAEYRSPARGKKIKKEKDSWLDRWMDLSK